MNTRLQNFLAAENITQSQLAENLGVARASISHILSGRNKPGFDFIESLANKFPLLNLEWLITGKGKMYLSPMVSNNTAPSASETQDGSLFPQEIQEQAANPESFSEHCDSPASISRDGEESITGEKPVIMPSCPELPDNKQETKCGHERKTISQIIIYYTDNTYEIVY